MTHPRDPRARRAHHRVDALDAALDAAVRLEVAADAMRASMNAAGPQLEELHALAVDLGGPGDLVDVNTSAAELLAADVVATVQLRTVEPPLTAQEFADALAAADDAPEPWRSALVDGIEQHRPADVAESPEPAPADTAERPDSNRTGTVADHRPAGPAPVSLPPAPVFSSEQRRLDWSSRHDERSRLYGVRAVLPGSAALHDHLWPVGPVLDQGAEGQCVGFAVTAADNVQTMTFAAEAGGRPILLGESDAAALYRRAQQLDEVPGEDYTGTSVLAGMRAAVEAGLFGGYRWAFGTRDIAQAVLQVGPVVVGVPWLAGMYDTGPGGLVVLEGDPVGGHCLTVVGIRLKGPQGQPGPFFVWQNSWGADYGDGGLGYIHHRDLAGLLHGVGEAAIPTATAQDPA